MKNTLKEILKITVLGSALVVVQAFAFSEPGTSAPGGSAVAPINVGNVTQEKIGSLIVLGLRSRWDTFLATDGGNVGICTMSPATKLHVVGGKAQADDFCLNSDPSTCLSAFYGPKLCVIGEKVSAEDGGFEEVINYYQPAPNFWTENHCRNFIASIRGTAGSGAIYALSCLQSDGKVSYSTDAFDRICFGSLNRSRSRASIPSPNCGL